MRRRWGTMTTLDVAKYLRAFQKAATTRKIKSRMIRREGRYDDNLAELIRAVLPKCYFRLVRRRRGYELMWTGTQEAAGRLLTRRVGGHFEEVVNMGTYRYQATLWIGQPTEELLAQAVALQPALARFKRDEARIANGEAVEAPAVAHTAVVEVVEPEDPPEIEEFDDEAPPVNRVVVAAEVTATATPQNVTAEIAAAMRARREALAPTPPAFQTEGARRFAEALAQANRGRQ